MKIKYPASTFLITSVQYAFISLRSSTKIYPHHSNLTQLKGHICCLPPGKEGCLQSLSRLVLSHNYQLSSRKSISVWWKKVRKANTNQSFICKKPGLSLKTKGVNEIQFS